MNKDIMKYIERIKECFNDETRFKSWDWCHNAFLKGRVDYKNSKNEDEKDKIIDYLTLHLAFYLASWGMYRGSSILLHKDYKIHIDAVKAILNGNPLLWNYMPSEDNIDEAKQALFSKDDGIYRKICDAYGDYTPSDTLVTKILLGTFGCIPAFDRFFIEGIKWYNNNATNNNKIKNLKYSIKEDDANEAFKLLTDFVLQNVIRNNKNENLEYPPMKYLDMYFWQIGYEISLYKTYLEIQSDHKTKDKKLKNLFDQIKSMHVVDDSVKKIDDAVGLIKKRYNLE